MADRPVNRVAVITGGNSEHRIGWCMAMVEGLQRHGVEVLGDPVPGVPVVTWSWHTGRVYRRMGHDVLVLERGYVGDRFAWCSAGWNGLNGRASFPRIDDGGERWRKHFAHLMQPWREDGDYALLLGQVPRDSAVRGVNLPGWYAVAVRSVKDMPVVFRPHPERRDVAMRDAPTLHGTLEEALSRAAVAITWNSNSGVDAALAGVPVIVCDEGSMAHAVAAHGLGAELVRPDRTAWAHALAWKQWTLDEVRSGDCWAVVKDALR